MPQDILEYFSYDINCPLWDTYDDRWWDPWCLAGFLGDDKFDYGAATTAVKTEEERSRPRGSSSWDGLALHREPHDAGPQRTAMVAMGPRVINPGAGPMSPWDQWRACTPAPLEVATPPKVSWPVFVDLTNDNDEENWKGLGFLPIFTSMPFLFLVCTM
jgi:hypothetical protein